MASTNRNIDPGMLAFYKALVAKTPAGSEHWPLAQQRAAWNALCTEFRAPRPSGLFVETINANGVPCHLFRPQGEGPYPTVIYSHGGGWVLGGPETHSDICAELAVAANCAVMLMDYRLAPEHPHPAQLEDSLKVWRFVRERGEVYGLDAGRIIAAGDSAGGQMSVALALTLRDLGLAPLQGLVLIYPVLGANTDTASYIRNADAPCLTRSEMQFYLEAFLGKPGSPAWSDEKAVPLLARTVEGLPPAFITVAEHDPLHDDGVMFHERLVSAGVPSTLRREPLLAHSHMRARHHSDVAMEAFEAIAKALGKIALSNPEPL
jgi:acetyl esterase